MPKADKPKKKAKGLRLFPAPKFISGAGAKRDKKLLDAEKKALGIK